MKVYQEIINQQFEFSKVTFCKVPGNWNKTPFPKRNYEEVTQYLPMVAEKTTLDRMLTSKSSQCEGQCCDSFDKLGPLDLHNDKWVTKCPCREKKIECGAHCGCKGKCFNSQIRNEQKLLIGKHIKETISWGFDLYTACNIGSILPNNISLLTKYDFLAKLTICLNSLDLRGWDMKLALKKIIDSDNDQIKSEGSQLQNKIFNHFDRQMSKILLCGINSQTVDKQEIHFRVFTKGIGIKCMQNDGIKANSLINEYYGEIYPPWRWFEKQDVIKQGQNKNKLSKELPEFYNIMFERHGNDPDGYDCLQIDPILRGSYCSRLSHSCFPNCSTVISVVDGRYSIGMYAIRDIMYGEELTFDYNSTTESEKEYSQAICLCGTYRCRGRYLALSTAKKFSRVMKKYHNFIDRNYMLWKACADPDLTD